MKRRTPKSADLQPGWIHKPGIEHGQQAAAQLLAMLAIKSGHFRRVSQRVAAGGAPLFRLEQVVPARERASRTRQARRLRRWPREAARPSLTAAIRLAFGCSGRDEKTALQPNEKTGLAVAEMRTTKQKLLPLTKPV